jgi:zinc D-Ala-D-Ala carboxypeptidase
MNLTENFTLEELCKTSRPFNNTPNEEQINALRTLAENVLQPLRNLYGKPITVNSGFRSDKVNRSVGGSSTSQHLRGEAADIDCGGDNRILYGLIRDNLEYDQLINEYDYKWIHVSYTTRRANRRKQIST